MRPSIMARHTALSSTLSVTMSPLLYKPLDFRDQPVSQSVLEGLTAKQYAVRIHWKEELEKEYSKEVECVIFSW